MIYLAYLLGFRKEWQPVPPRLLFRRSSHPRQDSDHPVTFTQTQPVPHSCGQPVRAVLCLAAIILTTPPAWAAAQSVAEVQVTPETMTLAVNQRQALFRSGLRSAGQPHPYGQVRFLELGYA